MPPPRAIAMALEKKTIKIIAIVVATVIAAVVLLGLLFGLLLRSDNGIELQVWPRGADGSAQPLISYRITDPKSYMPWVNRTHDFLSTYRNPRFGLNVMSCSYGEPVRENLFCDVDLREFHPCTSDNQYNYKRGAPCIFLRLDKILNWTPKPYTTTEDLPSNMTENLKQYIKTKVGSPEANEVWVSCDGVDPADKEFIGPVAFFPRRGLPSYYFPYKNQEGFLSPLVAVLFERPRTGIVINVECKAWAKNIACEDCEPSASVRFQLMVD